MRAFALCLWRTYNGVLTWLWTFRVVRWLMKEFLLYLLGAAKGGIAKLALGATGKVLDKAPVSQATTAKGLTAVGILMQGKPAPAYADADEERIAEGGLETAVATLAYPAFKLTAQDQADLTAPIGGVVEEFGVQYGARAPIPTSPIPPAQ